MPDHMELEDILINTMDNLDQQNCFSGDWNRFVCCGAIIPEGKMVCPICEGSIGREENQK